QAEDGIRDRNVTGVQTCALPIFRRKLIETLENQMEQDYVRGERRPRVEPLAIFPDEHLTFLNNVYNDKAREFYQKHGVKVIEKRSEERRVGKERRCEIHKYTENK